LDSLRQALELKQDHTVALRHLALTLAVIRKFDDAAAKLEALLKQTSDDAAKRLDLTVSLISRQNHAQALINLQ